jgi:DNA-binding response OmpR family regulator
VTLTNSTPYVLVVEDDLSLRDLYRTALRPAGHTVIAAEDGLEALRIVDNHRPAAIVLDLGLPNLGGRDVYKDLKARPETSHIPIVIITGGDMSDLPLDQFACFVLRKPFTIAQLIAAVENSLRPGARPTSDR